MDATVSLRTSDDSVTFNGSLRHGAHSLVTTNGAITITLPGDTAFRFDGQTINGSVRTEFTELTMPASTRITGSAAGSRDRFLGRPGRRTASWRHDPAP